MLFCILKNYKLKRMGANKKEHIKIKQWEVTPKWFLNLQIEQNNYNDLPHEIREQFVITKAYRTDIDYSKYEEYEPKSKEEIKKDKEREIVKQRINNLKENQ